MSSLAPTFDLIFGKAKILHVDPCSEYYLQGVNPLKSQRACVE